MSNDAQGTGLGNTPYPGTTIYPEIHDTDYPSALMTQGWCTGVPTDVVASRYQLNATLRQKDASVAIQYKNVGTVAAPVWAPDSGFFTAHAVYNIANDSGAAGTVTPKITAIIPANAIIVGGTINSTTAVSSSASMSVGVTAGLTPATTSLLGVTGAASLTTDALINATPTFASPKKMTAAGSITFTITGTTLTTGIVEAFFYYTVALNS